MQTKLVYAIFDKLASDIIGGLHLFNTEVAAVRFFSDVASNPETLVHKHIRDYELIQLARAVDSDHPSLSHHQQQHDDGQPLRVPQLIPDYKVVITGAAWAAAQQQQEAK